MDHKKSTINDQSNNVIPVISIFPIFFTDKELTDDPFKRQLLDVLVKDLTNAMENVGFIQISVPNLPMDLCRQLDQIQHEYFAMPISEKNKIKMSTEPG